MGGGSHRAPAASHKGFGQQLQLIGGIGVRMQIQRNIRRALVVGGAVFQCRFKAVIVLTIFVEAIVGKFIETRIHRAQRQF